MLSFSGFARRIRDLSNEMSDLQQKSFPFMEAAIQVMDIPGGGQRLGLQRAAAVYTHTRVILVTPVGERRLHGTPAAPGSCHTAYPPGQASHDNRMRHALLPGD